LRIPPNKKAVLLAPLNYQHSIQMNQTHKVMTKIIKNELYETLAQREFNPSETLKVIQYNKTVYWSWGVERKVNYYDKALLLIVNGHHHKGLLVITLAWNDTYSFHLINDDGTLKETVIEVYFDELQERIDQKIEYIENYK
jgi:hypothetical protein